MFRTNALLPAEAPAVARIVGLPLVGVAYPRLLSPENAVMPPAMTQSSDVAEVSEPAVAVAFTVNGDDVEMLESDVSVHIWAVIFILSDVPLLNTLAVYPLFAFQV